MIKQIQKSFVWVILIIVGLVAIVISIGENSAEAYSEFATRTNEPCSTCHINPGGGGPRTLRGMIWSSQGKPDQVPELLNILLAPDINDGVELYDVACAGCHGLSGEGLFGVSLRQTGLSERKIRSSTLRGLKRSGMPAFEGQFADEQLDSLVEYVAGISSGKIIPAPLSYPLPPGSLDCVEDQENRSCGGN